MQTCPLQRCWVSRCCRFMHCCQSHLHCFGRDTKPMAAQHPPPGSGRWAAPAHLLAAPCQDVLKSRTPGGLPATTWPLAGIEQQIARLSEIEALQEEWQIQVGALQLGPILAHHCSGRCRLHFVGPSAPLLALVPAGRGSGRGRAHAAQLGHLRRVALQESRTHRWRILPSAATPLSSRSGAPATSFLLSRTSLNFVPQRSQKFSFASMSCSSSASSSCAPLSCCSCAPLGIVLPAFPANCRADPSVALRYDSN